MISSAAPDISEREIDAVTEALSSGTLSTGEIVEQFEREFASFVGVEASGAVCSGSVALELVFEVSDLEPGDGVVVSPRNCAAVLYSILRQDLVPVFADIEPDGHNIDPDAVRETVSGSDQRIGAILATHLHGTPCDVRRLQSVAREFDLVLIEDFCQSPGATVEANPVGSFGSFAVCSFGATKNLTTAEGGIVVSDDTEKIERIRRLRSSRHGEADEPLRSVRMSDIEAAMGREQLRRYDEMVDRRNRIADIYREHLEGHVTLPKRPPFASNVFSSYPILVDDPRALQSHLSTRDIESNTYDSLLSEYDCLEESEYGEYPNAERVVSEAIVLPIHSCLDVSDAHTVVDAVKDYCA